METRGRLVRGWQQIFAAGAWLVLTLAIGLGCRELTNATSHPVAPPTSNVLSSNQFDDIPVPYGFVLETEPVRSLSFTGSYIYQAPDYREGRLLYSGNGDPAKILDFYRSQMVLPVNGWRSVAEDASAEGGDLVFEKGPSRSKLQVFQSGKSTYVMIEVSKANEG
jgi:hypothetical protein